MSGRVVTMGRIAGAFGVRGWVKVSPYSQDPAALLSQPRWLIEGPLGWTEHEVVQARMHGSAVIAQVEGIPTREDAIGRRGAAVGVPRETLPPLAEGEAYWADLEGLEVVNGRGERLGTVTGLLDNGAHGLLRVGGNDARDRLIPYVPAVVQAVDLDARRIVVDWEADW